MFCLVFVYVGCDVSNSLSSEDDFVFWVILFKFGVILFFCIFFVVVFFNLIVIFVLLILMVRIIFEVFCKVCEWRVFCLFCFGMLFF